MSLLLLFFLLKPPAEVAAIAFASVFPACDRHPHPDLDLHLHTDVVVESPVC